MIFLLLDGNEKPNEKSNEKSNETKPNETKPNQKPSGGKIGKCLQGTCRILQTNIFKKRLSYIFKVYNF